jgi:hypothetical protein
MAGARPCHGPTRAGEATARAGAPARCAYGSVGEISLGLDTGMVEAVGGGSGSFPLWVRRVLRLRLGAGLEGEGVGHGRAGGL